MQKISQLLKDLQYGTCILELEKRVQSHQEISPSILEAIPLEYLSSSGILLNFVGKRYLDNGELFKARELLTLAIKKFADHGMINHFITAWASLSLTHFRSGELSELLSNIEILRNEVDRTDGQIDPIVMLVLAKCCYLIDEGNLKEIYYKNALDLFVANGDATGLAKAMIEYALEETLMLDQPYWKSKKMYLDQQIIFHGQLHCYLTLFAAICSAQKEEWETVIQTLESCNFEEFYYQVICTMLLAKASISLKRHDAKLAVDELDQLLQTKSKHHGFQFIHECLKFSWHISNGMISDAEKHLQEIKALQSFFTTPFLQKLLSEMENKLSERSMDIKNTWDVIGFNEFKFVRNNIELNKISWKRRKAQELLVFLLLQPNYSISKEKVMEELFSDSDYQQMSNRLNVTIHSLNQVLKKVLNVASSVTNKDGVVRLQHDIIHSFDVEDYQTILRVADHLWVTNRGEAILYYEKAISKYGVIAPDLQYIDWLDRYRWELQDKQNTVLNRLACHSRDIGDFKKADYYYKKTIELMPFNEQNYRDFLDFLISINKKDEAKFHFMRFNELYIEEYGEVPEPIFGL